MMFPSSLPECSFFNSLTCCFVTFPLALSLIVTPWYLFVATVSSFCLSELVLFCPYAYLSHIMQLLNMPLLLELIISFSCVVLLNVLFFVYIKYHITYKKYQYSSVIVLYYTVLSKIFSSTSCISFVVYFFSFLRKILLKMNLANGPTMISCIGIAIIKFLQYVTR